MAESDGREPIDDDELLYRRIPVSMLWYSNNVLSPEAFDPRPDEVTGISIYRGKYKSIRQVAKGKSKKGYFVAVFRAGDLKQKGINVVPRPDTPEGWDAGHAELPCLTASNRDSDSAREAKLALTALPIEVQGPFMPEPMTDSGS